MTRAGAASFLPAVTVSRAFPKRQVSPVSWKPE